MISQSSGRVAMIRLLSCSKLPHRKASSSKICAGTPEFAVFPHNANMQSGPYRAARKLTVFLEKPLPLISSIFNSTIDTRCLDKTFYMGICLQEPFVTFGRSIKTDKKLVHFDSHYQKSHEYLYQNVLSGSRRRQPLDVHVAQWGSTKSRQREFYFWKARSITSQASSASLIVTSISR
jgi:hypothetical protein